MGKFLNRLPHTSVLKPIEVLESRLLFKVPIYFPAPITVEFSTLGSLHFSYDKYQKGLLIEGGGKSENIKLVLTGAKGKTGVSVGIIFGGKKITFDKVTTINVFTNGGADSVTVSGSSVKKGKEPVNLNILTDTGNDTVKFVNYDGDAYVSGGPGNDVISFKSAVPKGVISKNSLVADGDAGNDTILGSNGDDHLYGDDGNDKIDAGAGNDHIFGGLGTNRLIGGSGNDTFYINPINGLDKDKSWWGLGGKDIVSGNAGNDTLIEYFNSKLLKPIFGLKTIDKIEKIQTVDVKNNV